MFRRRPRPIPIDLAPQDEAVRDEARPTGTVPVGWTIAAIERPLLPDGLHGYVDSPTAGLAIGNWLAVAGWCFSRGSDDVVVDVFSGTTSLGILKGSIPRQDVAEAYRAQGIDPSIAMMCGFGGDLSVGDLSVGDHSVGDLSISVDDTVIVEVRATAGSTSGTLAHLHLHRGTDAATTNEEETSQAGEVSVLSHIMPADIPRIVVDIGAHDGRSLSNSYPYIAQGWSGVLIEPLPSVFERLVENHARHPHALCINVACGATSTTAPLFIGADGDLGQNSTLSTDDTAWMRDHRTDRSIDVRVERISVLLDEHDIGGDIGLLLVDCEGMDLEALQGLDTQRHRPWIVVTEQYVQNPAKEEAKAELLRSWGMTFRSSVGYNDIWVDLRVVPTAGHADAATA
jgi:FkbM family methyltransferase